ncbi:MAG: hypothetical protein JO250_20940 [Armatimonadetes bacterium]|nr:hypothetical protein [Armatimonadota bacterium]
MKRLPPCWATLTALYALGAAGLSGALPAHAQAVLLSDDFNGRPDGLITNEFAYFNPTAPGARHDGIWEMTSGSFFARGGLGYSGVPDTAAPNAASSNGTDSAVFRLDTIRRDFGDVAVDFDLNNRALYNNTGQPPDAGDGVTVWLRYYSQYTLYAIKVNRRDGGIDLKKKTPPGPSNGGTYYTLAHTTYAVPYGAWQHVRAAVRNNADGSVGLWLWINGRLVLTATDDGTYGGPPLRQPGGVGLRGDNCEFYVDNFAVTDVSDACALFPDTAQYNFETSAQDWQSTGGMITGVAQSAANAFDGCSGLAVHFAAAGPDVRQARVLAPPVPAGATVTFHVWLPASSRLTYVMPFVTEGPASGYRFDGSYRPASQLRAGAWNTIAVTVPPDAATPADVLGVEFGCDGPWSGTCYVDSVSW